MSCGALFLVFAKIALLTFGGGYAMVSLFQSELVARHALLSAADFANLIGLAQVTPGPIGFNSATYVGAIHGGLPGAVAASLGVMVPSLIVSLIVAVFLRKAAKAAWLKTLMKGVRPCVVGVIAAAVVFIGQTAVCWQGAVIFALVVLIRWRWRGLSPVWALIVSALLGWSLFLV